MKKLLAIFLFVIFGTSCLNSVVDAIGDSSGKELASSTSKTVYQINTMTCEQCGTCYDHCPDNAIKEVKLDGKTIFIVDPDLCTSCGICINVCKFGGMEIVPVAGD